MAPDLDAPEGSGCRCSFRVVAMPASFDRCIAKGGRVRTKTLKGGKYLRICYKDGKSYPSHVKRKIEKK